MVAGGMLWRPRADAIQLVGVPIGTDGESTVVMLQLHCRPEPSLEETVLHCLADTLSGDD